MKQGSFQCVRNKKCACMLIILIYKLHSEETVRARMNLTSIDPHVRILLDVKFGRFLLVFYPTVT